MFRVLLTGGFMLFSSLASADPIPEIQNFVREQIRLVGKVIDEGTLGESTFSPSADFSASMENYYFSGLEIRLQASVGFTLPWTANVQIYPILEIALERQ